MRLTNRRRVGVALSGPAHVAVMRVRLGVQKQQTRAVINRNFPHAHVVPAREASQAIYTLLIRGGSHPQGLQMDFYVE
ncbi:hypothetical protein Q7C36_020987 [Tachysurus vachellii]|uniref:Uncharacterized protein n=1 Tax=Tachysurus vachellii TaxID=175792 RepID=A0AA88IW23_TACVA|nr:hypothetical protein Q7C36_020987 [Tachysurus vachellii]